MDGMGRLQDGSPPCASAGQHRRTKTYEYGFVWASATGQISLSHCTGVQAVLSTSGRVAKYLACSDGPQSGSVYPLYQELLRPSLSLKTPAKPTPAPEEVPPVPSSAVATPSYHLCSLHNPFWSYDRLQSANHCGSWPALQVLKGQFRTHVRVT